MGLFKRNKTTLEAEVATASPPEKPSFFARLKQGLARTRSNLADGLANVMLGKKEIDEDLIENIETQLLTADVGIEATRSIITTLTEKVARKELNDPAALLKNLHTLLANMLQTNAKPLVIDQTQQPFVILMVGVNGVGKTTTIGKLAHQFKSAGKKVMLAAGDTFRAAAIDQLKVWGERNQIPVIAQQMGSDSASVIFDAVQAAKSRGIDVLIADTAGRLHTQDNLMNELKKIKRVMSKIDATLPQEVMLVLDASIGQNAIAQAKQFKEAVDVSGIVLTKLDGTAKGGIIFAIANTLNLPIRYIGVGEAIDDLRPFNADDFVKALFNHE